VGSSAHPFDITVLLQRYLNTLISQNAHEQYSLCCRMECRLILDTAYSTNLKPDVIIGTQHTMNTILFIMRGFTLLATELFAEFRHPI
jgi:hypothetical protein